MQCALKQLTKVPCLVAAEQLSKQDTREPLTNRVMGRGACFEFSISLKLSLNIK